MPRRIPSPDSEDERDGRPVKRSRAAGGTGHRPPPVGPDGYARGAIMRVRAENFMTYANTVDFRPGPKLNLIIGPNGAGKSSLVCALCIGLGGSPKLLGRARDLGEYVRRGAPSGWVEVTLSGGPPPGRPLVVWRGLTAGSRASEWRLDGAPATAAAVEAAVAALRVQLDNLCAFLPQDRVADLARLPPSALLAETERALGDAGLEALRGQLTVAVEDERAARSLAAALGAEAAAAARAQETGRAEADRAERVEALHRTLAAARGKVAWTRYAAAVDEAAEARTAADRARELLAQAERGGAGATAAAAAAAAAAADAGRAAAVTAHAAASNTAARAEAALRRAVEQGPDAARARLEGAREVLEGVPAAAEARERRLAAARADVAVAQAELAAITDEGGRGAGGGAQAAEARAAVAALQAGHTAAMEAERRARADAEAAAADAEAARSRAAALSTQARRAGDARARRTRELRSSAVADAVARSLPGGGAAAAGLAAAWRGPVFGPLGAEVAVSDPADAAALELLVPFHVLRRFVATSRPDQERLVGIVKARGETNPVSLVDEGARPPARIDLAASGLAALGARCMADAVTGPPPVLRCLLDECRLGSVVVAPPDASGGRADAISDAAQAAGARAVVFPGPVASRGVGTTVHRFIGSRYTKAVSISIESVRQPTVLGPDAAALAGTDGGGGGGGGGTSPPGAEGRDGRRRSSTGAAGGGAGTLEDRLAAARAEVDRTAAAAAAAATAHRAAADATRFEANRLAKAMREAASAEDKRKAARTRLAQAQRALAAVEGGPDPAAAAAEARRTLAAAAADAPAALARVAAAAEAYATAAAAAAAAAARRAEMDAAKRAADRARAAADAALARARNLAEAASLAERETLAASARLKAAALEATGGPLESWDLQPVALTLPDGEDELEEAAAAADAALAGIAPTDARALERHRARAASAAQLAARAADAAAQADAAAAAAADLRRQWAPRLAGLLAAVDARFGAAMRSLGCDGDVALREDAASGFHPDQAGADVRVRFRPGEPLARLDGARQSGGERSVATIVYLVALQAVSATPFRVVDEINQGMDPVNERAVFELLAREAASPGAPQVLLLTPKLLPGLPLHDPALTVLQVVNGPVTPGVGGPLGQVEARSLAGVRVEA